MNWEFKVLTNSGCNMIIMQVVISYDDLNLILKKLNFKSKV
jgi:hypothetical protein